MEAEFLLGLQELRTPFWDAVMSFITHLGDTGIFFIVLTIVMLVFPRTRWCGLTSAISLIAETLLNNVLLKNIVARTRPYEVIEGLTIIIEKQSDYSFPSGHAGIVFAGAIAVLMLCTRLAGDRRLPLWFGIFLTVLAALIAFSRLYVGVHYPSDVIAGMLLGIGTGVGAGFLTTKVFWRIEKKK